MGDSPAASTSLYFRPQKSTENFARLCQLIMKVCSDLFRDILSRYIKPAELRSELDKNKSKLKKVINRQQNELIYPVAGKIPISPKDLDISLLYIILRNICKIPEHKNGWGKKPIKGDNSISACIERIRFQRNLISAHSTNGEVDDTTFQNHWNKLSDAVLEVEKQLIGGESYERTVKSLLTCDLAAFRTDLIQDELKRLHERMDEVERTVRGERGNEKLPKQFEENLQNVSTEKDRNDDLNEDVDDDGYYCSVNDNYEFYDDDDCDDDDDDDGGGGGKHRGFYVDGYASGDDNRDVNGDDNYEDTSDEGDTNDFIHNDDVYDNGVQSNFSWDFMYQALPPNEKFQIKRPEVSPKPRNTE
nr:protein PFC0760c isoform X2 [Crassostrea gigas]